MLILRKGIHVGTFIQVNCIQVHIYCKVAGCLSVYFLLRAHFYGLYFLHIEHMQLSTFNANVYIVEYVCMC